jgi:hypothetical protein
MILCTNPVLPVFSVHSDYQMPTDCGYLKVRDMIKADLDKVKDILSGMPANLNHIILDWETSGQGDGGNFNQSKDVDQESTTMEDGALTVRSPAALNGQASFLHFPTQHWNSADDFFASLQPDYIASGDILEKQTPDPDNC